MSAPSSGWLGTDARCRQERWLPGQRNEALLWEDTPTVVKKVPLLWGKTPTVAEKMALLWGKTPTVAETMALLWGKTPTVAEGGCGSGGVG